MPNIVPSNLIPLNHMGDTSSWQHASIEGGDSKPGHWISKVKGFAASRVFWRILLSAVLLLLLVDILQHTATAISVLPATGPPISKIAPPSEHPGDVDWSQYAYCQYVTNEDYLCNSVMIFEALDRVGAKASKVMMYPQEWDVTADSHKAQLLRKARESYGVQLSPIPVQHFKGEPTWGDSFTKLLAFNQTQYKRVLSLDSDATVLKSMDELFLVPSAPVAMPRAYWLEDTLSSQLVLIEPSDFEFRRILDAFSHRSSKDFDMEIVNELYGKDCIVLPHRKYDLITGEFRASEHCKYLGSREEVWDPQKALDEAKFVHFSDWPLPKPWKHHSDKQMQELQPNCLETGGDQDCRSREIWLGLYKDFTERRQQVCRT